MIGEAQTFARLHRGHMAQCAGDALDRREVARRVVAPGADRIVSCQPSFQRAVRRVTGEAAQFTPAGTKAAAGSQQQRLMASVPGIAKIGIGGGGRRAVASAAHIVQGGTVEPPWLYGMHSRW